MMNLPSRRSTEINYWVCALSRFYLIHTHTRPHTAYKVRWNEVNQSSKLVAQRQPVVSGRKDHNAPKHSHQTPQKDTASTNKVPEKAVFSSIPSWPQMASLCYLSVLPHFGAPIPTMGRVGSQGHSADGDTAGENPVGKAEFSVRVRTFFLSLLLSTQH